MGGRWLVPVWLSFVLVVVAACGDNSRTRLDDAGPIDAIDAPDIDAPDAPLIDAACSVGATPTFCTGDGCTDIEIDPMNCGACGTECALTESCISGVCCTTGLANCSDVCADFQTDEMNCGACGTTCGTGESCVSGVCETDCVAPTPDNCGTAPGTCTNIGTDNDNCGTCGIQCTTGETCTGGTCACDTAGGLSDCSGTCTNTGNDPMNCGACGVACDTGEVCSNNQCIATCPAGTTTCDGRCVDLQSDPFDCGACGTVCDAGSVCSAGACVPDTTGCTGGATDCGDACVVTATDEANCGACGNECAIGATCTGGVCGCPSGQVDCNGVCVNTTSDEANCGACAGTPTAETCLTGESCVAGDCRTDCTAPTGTSCGAAPGVCTDTQTDGANCGTCGTLCTGGTVCSGGGCVCPAGTFDCNGTCVNRQTDENNCGTCGNDCGSGETCNAGICQTDCAAPTPNRCGADPGTCTDVMTDEVNCGACAGAPTAESCGAGENCIGGNCECVAPTPNDCNGTCTTTQTDPLNCGTCGNACPAQTPLCSGGQCLADCGGTTPNNCSNQCTNTMSDPANCGACGTTCPTGGVCTNGTCGCPAGAPLQCGNGPTAYCTNTETDPDNCGACGAVCNDNCSNGECCPSGQVGCNGACVDFDSDVNNCGGCGAAFACGAGESCTNGQCTCAFGTEDCSGTCKFTDTDPQNCGACGAVCPNGTACVSGGCVAACPTPLTECGPETAPTRCVNLGDDNNSCGNCGNVCPTGQGCSDGQCVPKVTFPTPGKCVGGGPPIVLPTGGGGTGTCSGNLGAVSFTFGLCSCTNIDTTADVATDAFDSSVGPYVAGGEGGGIGVNGTLAGTAAYDIGGDLWVWGAAGLDQKGDIYVHQDLQIQNAYRLVKLLTVEEDAYIGGAITAASGQTMGTIGTDPGMNFLYRDGTPTCAAGWPAALAVPTAPNGGCVTDPALVFRQPCACDAAEDELVPVRAIVSHFADPANNDNDLLVTTATPAGLPYDYLSNPSGAVRLELPCGYYYLNNINGSAPITIMVTGRTALFIGGSVRPSQEIYFDLQPGSTLDLFVAGVLTTSQTFYVGNPSYPRLSRVYIGSGSCQGSGTCGSNADCCSGVCSGGICGGIGGGGSLANAMQLSGQSNLNGVFYAGYGEVRLSNPLEMYGAIFANLYTSQGDTTIHYDKAVVDIGEQECPPPTGTCDSCRDCNNQACNLGVCGACDSDSDCCSPLKCVNPGPAGRCEL